MSCGQHVGEKTQAAAIDADQRHAAMRDQARGIEQGAVAANGDDQVGVIGDFCLRGRASTRSAGASSGSESGNKRADPALLEMREQSQRGLGNARVAESAYKRASLRR